MVVSGEFQGDPLLVHKDVSVFGATCDCHITSNQLLDVAETLDVESEGWGGARIEGSFHLLSPLGVGLLPTNNG